MGYKGSNLVVPYAMQAPYPLYYLPNKLYSVLPFGNYPVFIVYLVWVCYLDSLSTQEKNLVLIAAVTSPGVIS